MPALERIGRGTSAPPDPIRAASQCAGALLRLAMPGGEDVGTRQLLAAVGRMAAGAVRSGLSGAEVVSDLLSPEVPASLPGR